MAYRDLALQAYAAAQTTAASTLRTAALTRLTAVALTDSTGKVVLDVKLVTQETIDTAAGTVVFNADGTFFLVKGQDVHLARRGADGRWEPGQVVTSLVDVGKALAG